ncbi:hypothetical protein PCYB_005530 [Plasmodium cynomolgi strain B]|uniref:CYIR protein n=1 Tax=Plasmodium cynomolgi (strain B) TaxID=1120755 RepID=K6V0F4_PLACD|nr:hypothetical protein PCYB_005530 [Plasmodium cynomolgi strain B]GAB69804.1 hypothetical protein PCYB_005530 [Plasmodium cynomolgi strain B]
MNLPSGALPSKNFYNELETTFNELGEHDVKCNSDYLQYSEPNIIKICATLVKYLNTNPENERNLKDQHCNLLSLWIYEQLFKYFPDEANRLVLSDIFANRNDLQVDKCLRDVIVLSYDNWKERKDLYDYCVDYHEFNFLNDFSDEKCKEYEKYIEEKSPLYDKYDSLYMQAYEKDVFYKKCKYYNPKKRNT